MSRDTARTSVPGSASRATIVMKTRDLPKGASCVFEGAYATVAAAKLCEICGLVRHPPQSGWLDKWGRLKGGRLLSLGVALKRAYIRK